MRKTRQALRDGALIGALVCLALPLTALAADTLVFVGDHASYAGKYRISDRTMSVVIDGHPYRGQFSNKSSDAGSQSAPPAAASGRWGRAFLFASSAKVMQCALDTGPPHISGRCEDADGRPFELMPASKR